MPDRPVDPRSASNLFNEILARLRAVERARREVSPIAATVEGEGAPTPPSYSWQSPFTLTPATAGHKLFADRYGGIVFVRAERSSGDGVSTAEFDVELNGVTIFDPLDRPKVLAGIHRPKNIRPRAGCEERRFVCEQNARSENWH